MRLRAVHSMSLPRVEGHQASFRYGAAVFDCPMTIALGSIALNTRRLSCRDVFSSFPFSGIYTYKHMSGEYFTVCTFIYCPIIVCHLITLLYSCIFLFVGVFGL